MLFFLTCAVALCAMGITQTPSMMFAVATNMVVRCNWPSSYVPAVQSNSSVLASPLLARCLAFWAELFYYHRLMEFVKEDNNNLRLLFMCGEIMCVCHVLFQSELLGWIEDIMWTVFHFLVMIFTTTPLVRYCICLPFVSYMLLIHLFWWYIHRVRSAPLSHGFYHNVLSVGHVNFDMITTTMLNVMLKTITFLALELIT
jgi:hypothetical protein